MSSQYSQINGYFVHIFKCLSKHYTSSFLFPPADELLKACLKHKELHTHDMCTIHMKMKPNSWLLLNFFFLLNHVSLLDILTSVGTKILPLRLMKQGQILLLSRTQNSSFTQLDHLCRTLTLKTNQTLKSVSCAPLFSSSEVYFQIMSPFLWKPNKLFCFNNKSIMKDVQTTGQKCIKWKQSATHVTLHIFLDPVHFLLTPTEPWERFRPEI